MNVKKLILAVDDNERILSLLKLVLSRAGFEVTIASSGKQAQQIMENENPDLLILDVSLNDISGLELLRDIRKDSDTPAIILSALSETVKGTETFSNTAYLAKPFDPEELVRKTTALLGPVWILRKYRSSGNVILS